MRWYLLVVIAAACNGTPAGGGGGGGDDQPPVDAAKPTNDGQPGVRGVFDPLVTDVTIEIDYEAGAEPYTGPILGFGDTFDLTAANLDRLFAGKKALTLPRTTSTMENIGAVPDQELTVADLLAIAQAHRSQIDTATKKTYYVLFVGGHFADGNGPNPNVLGVSLGGTGVVAMFKDVIRSTNVVGLPNVVRYVEQSTLIHEVAHAVGLVDTGVTMAQPHRDATHGAHCTNERCVMYWLNEGASDAAAYAQQHVLSNNSILFDAACLADVDALTGGP
jgi:hypothetical protein